MTESEEPEDGLSTVVHGAGILFGGRIFKLFVLFLSHLIMARLLGSSSYGGIVLATITLNVAALVAKLGLGAGLTRLIPYYEDEIPKARGAFRSGYVIGICASMLLGVALFVSAPLLARVVFNDASLTRLLRIAVIGLPFSVLLKVSIAIAQGSRDAKTQVLIKHFLQPASRTLLIAVFVLAGFGAVGAMSGHIIALALAAIAAIWLAFKSINFPVRGPSESMYAEVLSFSIPLLFSASMNFVIFNSDTLLIGMFAESGQVGIYNIAFQFRSLGMFFFYPLGFLLPPVLTRLSKQQQQTELRRIYQVTTKWMILLTFPVFVVMVTFPTQIIGVSFGPQYVDGALVLQIFLCSVILTVFLGPNGRSLVALGHNKLNMYINVCCGLINIGLNVLLIPMFGIVGAGAASATALAFRDVAFTVALHLREGVQPISAAAVKPVLVSGLAAATTFTVTATLFVPTIAVAVGFGIVITVLHGFSVLLFGGLEPKDREIITLVENRSGLDLDRFKTIITSLQRNV